jgi:KaiC/GvpD/RAD55 family RecA-like ATPase
MKRIDVEQSWLRRLMPEGFPTHTSTLITGPGGSGKPLIGNLIAAAWLRQAGSVVFMSLQYPSHEFIISGLKKVAQLDLAEYATRSAFVELDATLEGIVTVTGHHLKANLVIPDIWDTAIEQASSMVPDEGPGILVFGSALNLLLFSPTYAEAVLARMKRTVAADKRRTYLFSVSTTAKEEMIAELEAAADNLISSRSLKGPFRLFIQILRMKNTAFLSEEVEFPLAPEELEEVKEIADHSRKRVIPLIAEI